jgi:hypothetical protein
MPLYSMKCHECMHECDVYLKMCGAADAPPCYCPLCGEGMVRQVAQVHTDIKDFARPIDLFSIGCNSIDEIRQMQAAGIQCSDDTNDPMHGVPIARNRAEKKRALKIAGFQEAN